MDDLNLSGNFDNFQRIPTCVNTDGCKIKVLWSGYNEGNQGFACKLSEVINQQSISSYAIELSK